jgi:hypothetical protein
LGARAVADCGSTRVDADSRSGDMPHIHHQRRIGAFGAGLRGRQHALGDARGVIRREFVDIVATGLF